MTLSEIKKHIAQLLTCHVNDLTTAYIKSVMQQLGYILDFRMKESWLKTLEVLNQFLTDQDRVHLGTRMGCLQWNPFYNFSHIPNLKNSYYHRETNWNITHKLQYCDPAIGVITRDVWVIFIPDRAVYEIRRIRLRCDHLDGRYEERTYDYVPSKVTAVVKSSSPAGCS